MCFKNHSQTDGLIHKHFFIIKIKVQQSKMAVNGENRSVSGWSSHYCSNSTEISKHSGGFVALFPSACLQTMPLSLWQLLINTQDFFHSTINEAIIIILLNCYVQQCVLEPTSGHKVFLQRRGQESWKNTEHAGRLNITRLK